MANGTSHVGSKYHCDLCGRKDGVKFSCTMKECHNSGGAMVPYRFHLTCGRQAGLDVHDVDNDTQGFYVKCFHHVRCSEVVRAKMEDMLEVEKRRCGKMLERAAMPMPFGDAAQLMHWSVTVLANLGWAWRWSEWWVERGDNWEPLHSILLVDFIRHADPDADKIETLIEAGAIRFKPILLTAVAAMIGAAVILTDPIFQGLALSLLFGLLSSTLLTVLVIPAIYRVFRT